MLILAIILLTCGVSIGAWSRRDIFYKLALSYRETVEEKQLYRLLSHMLVHGGWMHLFINMYVFYSFGSALVYQFSYFYEIGMLSFPRVQFLFLYFGGGITAGLFSLLFRKDRRIVSVGASGGVAALVFASIFFAPWRKLYLFGLVGLPGIVLGGAYLLYSWYMARRAMDNIDHNAHFYGALYGFVYPVVAIEPKLFFDFLERLTSFS